MPDGPTETLIRRGSYPLKPISRRTVDAGSYGISWPAPGCWGRRVDRLNVPTFGRRRLREYRLCCGVDVVFKFRGRNVDRRASASHATVVVPWPWTARRRRHGRVE